MANLQNIRRRIKSVKNIQKITNAMDMIARSRFNASRDALISYLPYVDKTQEIMRRVMSQMKGLEDDSPFICTRQQLLELQQQSDRKFLFLVIASDKGLAGAYSSNVLKEAHDTIEYDGTIDPAKPIKKENFHIKNFDAVKNVKVSRSTKNRQSKQFTSTSRYTSATIDRPRGGADITANLEVAKVYHDEIFIDDVELITIGRKATTHFKQRGYNIIKHFHGISERPTYQVAKDIADLIIHRFLSGEILDVTMIYTQFKSAISCEPDDVTLLPIVTDDFVVADNLDLREAYIYEPNVVSVLNNFLLTILHQNLYNTSAKFFTMEVIFMSWQVNTPATGKFPIAIDNEGYITTGTPAGVKTFSFAMVNPNVITSESGDSDFTGIGEVLGYLCTADNSIEPFIGEAKLTLNYEVT